MLMEKSVVRLPEIVWVNSSSTLPITKLEKSEEYRIRSRRPIINQQQECLIIFLWCASACWQRAIGFKRGPLADGWVDSWLADWMANELTRDTEEQL